jgi:hypothetical protein
MKKVILLLTLGLLLLPVMAMAVDSCPDYTMGFNVSTQGCIFQINFPVVGSTVVLTVGADVLNFATGADGTVVAKFVGNHCTPTGTPPVVKGFIRETATAVVTLPAYLGGFSKTCTNSWYFICCCPACGSQSKLFPCDINFQFCCGADPGPL